MDVEEMKRVTSGIASGQAHADPAGCINALDPLLSTAEGRKFLSKREGKEAMVLIELFDWVAILPGSFAFPTRTENVVFRL